jgi:GlcNAc-P-P-Und epimerase
MILITGGSGFIGTHFHNYIDQSYIINLDLNKPADRIKSEYRKGDIRVKSDIETAVKGKSIDYIISLAAKHHDFGIGHDEYFDTNEDGTKILCSVASEYNIKKIVFYSSVAVYGIRPEISNENLKPAPDSPYGASKLAGEEVLKKWQSEDPSRTVIIIRPTIVFGAYNVANMFNLIRQIDSRFYFHLGKADNIKSIAYVENLVQATLFIVEKAQPGFCIYNYADEPQLTTREIAKTISEHLRKKIWLTIPKSLGIILGKPFDLAIKITGKNLPISSARIKKLSVSTHHSAQKLFSEGFKPKFSTYDGLRKMVEWFQVSKQ